MNLPIYELMIDNDNLEVNYMALVDKPAIEKDFMSFNEQFESFADYPDGVKNNAKNVLEYADKNGWGSCGTPVGKQRANQLAKGEAISVDTIQRMYSYLSRHEVDLESSENYGDGCGKLMYDAWGGKAALGWSRNKLRELKLLEFAVTEGEINVLGYHTNNFKICPMVYSLFEHIATMQLDDDTIGMVRSAVQIADNIFAVEIKVTENNIATQHEYEEAVILVDDFKDLMGEIDKIVLMQHDVSFMDKHIETIKQYLPKAAFFSIDSERQIISGPAMLADVPIYRRDEDGTEYMIVFKPDTIYKIAQKFFEKNYQGNFNIMHNPEMRVDGVNVFESFIVDSERGIKPMAGYEDAKNGSWFISAKVDNIGVWNAIKDGKIKGFSVEGMFGYKKVLTRDEYTLNEIKSILSGIDL